MPSVLFLPGSGADPSFWHSVGNRLPDEWPKTYLGWPGLGHNPPSSEVNSLEDLVALAERHLTAPSVDIVAQSFGGAVALLVALRNPGRVRRLVLATSAAGLSVGHLGAADWRPSYREEYPNAAAWVYTAQSQVDDRLHEIAQPTLLLWGDSDPISPVKVGEHLLEALPNAFLRVVEGGTHALAMERSQEVAELIAEFLSA